MSEFNNDKKQEPTSFQISRVVYLLGAILLFGVVRGAFRGMVKMATSPSPQQVGHVEPLRPALPRDQQKTDMLKVQIKQQMKTLTQEQRQAIPMLQDNFTFLLALEGLDVGQLEDLQKSLETLAISSPSSLDSNVPPQDPALHSSE